MILYRTERELLRYFLNRGNTRLSFAALHQGSHRDMMRRLSKLSLQVYCCLMAANFLLTFRNVNEYHNG